MCNYCSHFSDGETKPQEVKIFVQGPMACNQLSENLVPDMLTKEDDSLIFLRKMIVLNYIFL